MSALVIAFPVAAMHRDPDVVEALEKLAMCEATIAEGVAFDQPHKVAIGGIMKDWWEKELARLTGAGGSVH